jgi:hypothetical protein
MRGVFACLELHNRKSALGVWALAWRMMKIVHFTVINYQP